MIAKQDRHGVRTASDLVRRYKFRKKFSETLGVATDARKEAEQAMAETIELSDNISLKATHDIPGKKTIIDLLVDNKKYSGEIDMSDFYTKEEINQLAQDLVGNLGELFATPLYVEESIAEAIKNIPTGVSKTLLWENAAPSSSFPAQDIEIPGLNTYHEIEVEFRISLSVLGSKGDMRVRSAVSVDKAAHKTFPMGTAFAHVTSSQTVERMFYKSSNAAVTFGNCIAAGVGTSASQVYGGLIPYRIYGIRGVEV